MHCESIVWMGKTTPFTVTLPEPAVRLIIALIPGGLHGSTRAEVARTLILDQLKLLRAQGLKEAEGEVADAD